jgi:small subunit ribosomal protein S2
MKKIPEVLFVVDGVYEEQAIKEANSLKLKSFAILNTNGDDTVVDNLIPANTNSVKSTEYIANAIKSELSGIRVSATSNAKVNKMSDKKVSGETKTTIKKIEVKKAVKIEEVKETVSTEEK